MTQLNFDEHGNLTPYKMIEVDVATLEHYFVTAFPNSITRKRLFENYLRYLYRFQDEVFPFFEQWIDGSFVTQKENPQDIDLVTFLDYEVYEKRGDAVLNKFWTFSLEDEGIDSYIAKQYPSTHKFYKKTLSSEKYWLKLYGSNRAETMYKGFIKIIFEK